jgi:hypothetical protein
MTTKILSPKAPGELIPVVFDFTNLLGVLTIASVVSVGVETDAGTDATPSAILSGSASIQDAYVIQHVTAGTAGVDYRLTATITTSGSPSRTLVLAAILPVRKA